MVYPHAGLEIGSATPYAILRESNQDSHEEAWGKGNLQAPLGMHDPNPMKSKTSSCFLADPPSVWVSPKNSVILASAMTQSGVLGKEMMVYVDKRNM